MAVPKSSPTLAADAFRAEGLFAGRSLDTSVDQGHERCSASAVTAPHNDGPREAFAPRWRVDTERVVEASGLSDGHVANRVSVATVLTVASLVATPRGDGDRRQSTRLGHSTLFHSSGPWSDEKKPRPAEIGDLAGLDCEVVRWPIPRSHGWLPKCQYP